MEQKGARGRREELSFFSVPITLPPPPPYAHTHTHTHTLLLVSPLSPVPYLSRPIPKEPKGPLVRREISRYLLLTLLWSMCILSVALTTAKGPQVLQCNLSSCSCFLLPYKLPSMGLLGSKRETQVDVFTQGHGTCNILLKLVSGKC